MSYNVWEYIRFAQRMRSEDYWKTEQQIFNIPVILLILFLIGYIAVALFGRPDLIVSSILLGGSIFVSVIELLIRRITDRIRKNERLHARALAAEASSEAKTRFLSNMSHDIRTPLNAIIGYTILAKSSPLEQLPEYIDKIDHASHQMLALVNEVLEMSRIESGKLELEPVNTDLESIVKHTASMFHSQMKSKQISFTVSCRIKNNWVICDGHRLGRVLMNMLSNACKFTEPGGKVSLSAEQIDDDSQSLHYIFKVSDNGIGMSPDFIQNVFTPFERERTSTVSRTQGTGLGMAICKNIVEMMGGTISVESVPGMGTTFTVFLSLPPGRQEAADPLPAKVLDTTVDFSAVRLLLAEDNEVNREIAVMILSQAGFTVDTAENGQIALDRIASSRPGYYQAVLMDIQMPVMDGYTAARQIRALADPQLSSIPIIAMTANAFAQDRQDAKDAGMQAHISKPLDVEQMMQTIKEVLESNTVQDEL